MGSLSEPTRVAPEERFEELLRAGRVLIIEGVIDEDQIYPTLAFANWVSQRSSHLTAEKEKDLKAIGGKNGVISRDLQAQFWSRFRQIVP